jgi:hypothetical protein
MQQVFQRGSCMAQVCLKVHQERRSGPYLVEQMEPGDVRAPAGIGATHAGWSSHGGGVKPSNEIRCHNPCRTHSGAFICVLLVVTVYVAAGAAADWPVWSCNGDA